MTSRSYFVVGETFHEFAKGKDVLTINQLKALTRLPNRVLNAHNVLLLGQGATTEDLQCVLRACNDNPELGMRFEVSDLRRVLDRAPSAASHKRIAHNTLIGLPVRTGSDSFEVPILLDERCELMGDHQTGQHVQGMLLVEACRQSFLAVTETYFPFGQGPTYFVINHMKVEFQNFVFPLPAHIDYRVVSADVTDRRARYETTMKTMQNGAACATAAIGFTVYPSEVIARKEAELAALVTETMLASRRKAVAANQPDNQPDDHADTERIHEVDLETEGAA
jgi:hypothetical protein